MNIVSGSYTVQTLNYSNRTVLITDSSLTNNQGCFGDISDRSFVISSGKPLHLHDTVFIFTGCDRSKGPLLEGSKYRCNFSNDICSAYQRCGSNPARNFPGCCSHRADAVDYINLETLNCSSNGLNMGFTSVVNLNPLDDSADWVHGFQMQWNGILTTSKQCDACSSSKGVCGYDQSDKSFLCYCSGGVNRTTTCSTGSSRSPPSPDDNLDAPSPQPPSPSGENFCRRPPFFELQTFAPTLPRLLHSVKDSVASTLNIAQRLKFCSGCLRGVADTGKSKKSVVVPVALSE